MSRLESTAKVLLEVWLDGLPSNPNVTRGAHWSKLYSEQQEWKRTAWLLARSAYHGKPLDRAHVHYFIFVGDQRAHDADNLIASLKPVQDGLKGVVLLDDSIDNIEVTYTFSREKPRGVRIVVTSEPEL
jgi:hypothetical protein